MYANISRPCDYMLNHYMLSASSALTPLKKNYAPMSSDTTMTIIILLVLNLQLDALQQVKGILGQCFS